MFHCFCFSFMTYIHIDYSQVPVKPLLKGSLDMILAILKRDTVSHESHLVTEDVLDIIIKRSMPA